MIANITGQFLDPTYRLPGEALESYVGKAVDLSGALVVPMSTTNQAGTQARFGLGVLRDSGSFANDRGVEIWTDGAIVEAIAGTGGVAAGDTIVPEYAASGTDRGRFIGRDTSELSDGDVVWGTAQTAAAEDGRFSFLLNRRKVNLDGTGA
jgi:hypothetical protein